MFATLLAALVNELAPERLRALVIAALTNTPPTTPTLPAPAPAELEATPALIEPAERPKRRRRRRAGEKPQKRVVARNGSALPEAPSLRLRGRRR